VVRRTSAYSLGLFGWAIVVFGTTVAVFSGNAAPLVTPSDLPVGGPLALFVSAVGLFLVGMLVVNRLKRRDWTAAGRAAGLEPEGGGLFETPDMVGTVGGRAVRATTITRKTSSSTGNGNDTTTYTVVEADLREPIEEGLVVGERQDEPLLGTSDVGGFENEELPAGVDAETVGEHRVISGEGPSAEAVLPPRARDALEASALLDGV